MILAKEGLHPVWSLPPQEAQTLGTLFFRLGPVCDPDLDQQTLLALELGP